MREAIGRFLDRFLGTRRRRSGAILLILLVLAFNTVIDSYSIYDRSKIKEAAATSRAMLDARARIQIMVIEKNWEKFTPAEQQFIQENFKTAEYDKAKALP